jgi:hypothetical protein
MLGMQWDWYQCLVLAFQGMQRKNCQCTALLRDAEIANVPFMASAGGMQRKALRAQCGQDHTRDEQRSNAPASAARNGMFAISASLTVLVLLILAVSPYLL